MDSSFSVQSRRSYDLPKPETGLAEWTSKIKALQQQVDADEEDEQRRLEEEIAAARQARLRRSRGMGGGNRADSADLSINKDRLGFTDNPNDTSAKDSPKSFSDRQNDRESALRKLMDRNDVYNPDKIGEPVGSSSLASFIGGTATGPRLNRHAPQQDAHDPTQYIQPDLSAPHPVFGKGGVAMPGLATKKSSTPILGSELSERYRPSGTTPTSSTSPIVRQESVSLEEPTTKVINRRSFTSVPKSPSPALTQRYTEKIDTPVSRDTTFSSDPSLNKRKSFGSIPKSTSPLPSTKAIDTPSSNVNTAPLKASDFYRSPSIISIPKPTSYVPSSPKKETTSKDFDTSGTRPADSYRSPSSISTPHMSSKPTSSYTGAPIAFSATSSQPRYGTASTTSKTDTPLQRIMERNNVYNPDKVAADNSRKSVAERAQTTSLAAFMGAPGKGIRLNKHAPQVDAHDPTQYIQPDLRAPHPIFGNGGVAMPGMVTRRSAPDPAAAVDDRELAKPSSTKKATWPPVSPTVERSVSPQKTGTRERTTSAPRAVPTSSFSGSQASNWTSSRADNRSQSPTKGATLTTPVRDRTISTPSAASKSAISTPSLARPRQPEPMASSLSPQIPATITSPAFLKPAVQKDLTPSLSRLQGRGFVQNMVKATSQLSETPSPSPPPTRPPSAGSKKSSVLDRWQQNVQPASPTKSPSTLYSSAATKRTATGSSTSSNGHGLKSSASFPSLNKEEQAPPEVPYQRSRTPGLGSATTMVVIKPSKSFTDLTEMGMKPDSNPSPSSRKPLTHLTKERARKPKKSHDNQILPGTISQDLAESPVEERSQDVTEVVITRPGSATRDVFDLFTEAPPSRTAPNSDLKDELTTHNLPPVGSSFSKLSNEIARAKTPEDTSPSPPSTKSDTPPTPGKERNGASSPAKHSRIPSTGKRPTVMEVAQALIEIPEQLEEREPEPQQFNGVTVVEAADEVLPMSPVMEAVPRPRNSISQIQAEKRRSNYERYSAIILPMLKEEVTPTSSPAGTLKHAPEPVHEDVVLHDLVEGDESDEDEDEEEEEEEEELQREELKPEEVVEEVPLLTEVPPPTKLDNVVHIPLSDAPSIQLSSKQVAELLNSRSQPFKQAGDVQTISVEVLSIVGNAASTISGQSDIFYDTEILAVIHRVKVRSSGLASTSVWCWLGRQTRLGDREEKKLNELAKRYSTTAKIVHQLAEPAELFQILGGRLAIRQGTRNHWSSENITMHLVRKLGGVILVDEYELDKKTLCSAFSYCFTLLGSIYVWHGCGSTLEERKAAVEYAHTLSPDPVSPIELVEGEDDEDEMFWMMLGDDEFAEANYWRWRKSSSEMDPSIWRIETSNSKKPVVPVTFISMEQDLQNFVYVINCVWELFVLVGKNARNQRQSIRCALDVAKKISSETASARPYKPTIHVLILPSQLPLDLSVGIRDLDEAWLNNGDIPDHMNLISIETADEHLRKDTWERAALRDLEMLPLGVDAADVQEAA